MEDEVGRSDAFSRTEAIWDRFLQSLRRIEFFFQDAERGFEKSEEMWSSILRALNRAERGDPPEPVADPVSVELKLDEVQAFKDLATEALGAIEQYPGMLGEMGLISLFATYDAFLSDLLTEVFRARPELLKSGKRVTAEVILNASSLDEVVEELIAREIQDWRLSFREQVRSLDDRFGVSICKNESEVATLSEAHERRHLFVHRGGIVDGRYLSAIPAAEVSRGARVSADIDYCRGVSSALVTIAKAIATELPKRCLSEGDAQAVEDRT